MLAKVPPKRSDNNSSFGKLIEYITNKDEEEDHLNDSDKLNSSERRRHNEILDSIRRNLKDTSNHLKAARRIDPADANAIRSYLRNIGKIIAVNGRRYDRSSRQPETNSGELNDYQHQRSVSSTGDNLKSAARHIKQIGRVDRDFQERARTRRANIAFSASASKRQNRRNKRDSKEIDVNSKERSYERILGAIDSNLKDANYYLKTLKQGGSEDSILKNLKKAKLLAELYKRQNQKVVARTENNLKLAGVYLRQVNSIDTSLLERIRARKEALVLSSAINQLESKVSETVDDDDLSLLADYQRVRTPSNVSCQHNCVSLETASAEMKAVADLNVRVKDPVYHIVLSWPESESPSDEQAFECGLHAMKAVGMEEHQYVFAVHRDTDNAHLHMTINRVNPNTLKAVYPDRDFYKLDRAMRELELEYGWQHDNGPYAVFERNGKQIIDWASKSPNSKEKQPTQAADMERYSGQESFYSYVRDNARKEVVELLKQYQLSWQELHTCLSKYGLDIREKGRGLAIYDAINDQTVPIKASDLHEQLSKSRLEKRIGKYQPYQGSREEKGNKTTNKYNKLREIKRNPVLREEQRLQRADARRQLREAYQEYKKDFVYKRLDSSLVKAQYAEIQEKAKNKRAQVRETIHNPDLRKQQYSIIAFETLREREKLKAKLKEEREALRQDPTNKRLTYRDWVKVQAAAGNNAAISQLRGWAYAEKRQAKALSQVENDNSINGIRSQANDDPIVINVQGVHFDVIGDGSVIYQRNNIPMFTDHGRVLTVNENVEMSQHDIEIALMVAKEKYQGSFELTGSDSFKIQVIQIINDKKLDVKLTNSDIDELKRLNPSQKNRRNRVNKLKGK